MSVQRSSELFRVQLEVKRRDGFTRRSFGHILADISGYRQGR